MQAIGVYLLGLFFMIPDISCAQTPKISDSIPRPQIEKFIGTWKWVSDSAEMIIKLKKATASIKPDNIRENMLIGVHYFKKNGIVVENYLREFDFLQYASTGTIFLMAKYDGTNPDEVDGTLKDTPKDKHDYLSLVFNHTTKPSLTLYLNNMSGPGTGKKKKPVDYSFTFPSNIILIKQD